MFARTVAIPLLLLTAPACWAAPTAAPETASLRLACDSINVAGSLDQATAKDLGPAHSLDAAAAVLDQHKIKYTRGHGVMTISDAPAAMVQQIYQLPQGEPIVLPNGEDTTICVPRPSADSI